MAENLRTPGQADQIIMFEHAAMTLKIAARFEGENKMLVGEADQLSEVAVTRCG